MPTVVTERPYRHVPTEPPRKRWTRAECKKLESSGLWDGLHLELVDGELISKTGKNRPHVNTFVAVQAWLLEVFGVQYVNAEAPIDVDPQDNTVSEPEPDLIVLTKPTREFHDANPRPEDIRLVIEISDSTLGHDLTTKAEMYARAGIVEYWVFDVAARRIVVHRDPRSGLYRCVLVFGGNESVSPLAAPQSELPVTEAFGNV